MSEKTQGEEQWQKQQRGKKTVMEILTWNHRMAFSISCTLYGSIKLKSSMKRVAGLGRMAATGAFSRHGDRHPQLSREDLTFIPSVRKGLKKSVRSRTEPCSFCEQCQLGTTGSCSCTRTAWHLTPPTHCFLG
ncbi:uncharacterized protein ACNLHF_022583 [Anomaloglossus baeobatrachus]